MVEEETKSTLSLILIILTIVILIFILVGLFTGELFARKICFLISEKLSFGWSLKIKPLDLICEFLPI